jgi:hypothetical protein
MKLEQMSITLPSATGNSVIMKKYMTPIEIEDYRRQVTGMFELHGFAGALISFSFAEDAADLLSPPPEIVHPEPAGDPDPDPVTLPQYRKLNSIFELFKK